MRLTPEQKNRIVNGCLALVGEKYVFGAEVDLSAINSKITIDELKEYIVTVDCSELVQVIYKFATGKVVVDGSFNQYYASHPLDQLWKLVDEDSWGEYGVDFDELKPELVEKLKKSAIHLDIGDLGFKKTRKVGKEKVVGHVGIYIGNDEVVEAKGKDYGVIKSHRADWELSTVFGGWRRLKEFV